MIYLSTSWIKPLKNARQPAPIQTHAAVFLPLEDFLFAKRNRIIPTTRTTTPAIVFNTGPVPPKKLSRKLSNDLSNGYTSIFFIFDASIQAEAAPAATATSIEPTNKLSLLTFEELNTAFSVRLLISAANTIEDTIVAGTDRFAKKPIPAAPNLYWAHRCRG